MPFLTLSHLTTYTYRQPVSFGEHRIMVRPRESYDQHLIEARLDIDPQPLELRWLQDVFGNSVAIATFDRRAKELVIESRLRVEHRPDFVRQENGELFDQRTADLRGDFRIFQSHRMRDWGPAICGPPRALGKWIVGAMC